VRPEFSVMNILEHSRRSPHRAHRFANQEN
jgi:hypothetical protein